MQGKRNSKKILLITLAVVAALILLILGGIMIYVDSLVDKVVSKGGNTTTTVDTVLSLPPEPTESWDETVPTLPPQETTAPTIPAELIEVKDVISVMLIGTDQKDGAARGRSDSMILCTIKVKQKTVCMTSFHRDTWVYIPDWWHGKLNAAFVYGGFELFKQTMEYNFGVQLDHILLMEFEHFTEVVDLLGGVDVELEQREADYLLRSYPAHNWQLSAGMNHLDGTQALAYSRIRAIDSNWQRNERQKQVLRSIFQAYRQKPIWELLDITSQILPLIQTYDLEKEEVYNLLFTLMPMLSGCTIENYAFPKGGTFNDGLNADGIWVIEITDMQANRDYLAQIICP